MSDKIEIKGKVDKILDVQEFSSGFKKQVIVIEVDGKFPQKVAVEFGKEKIAALADPPEIFGENDNSKSKLPSVGFVNVPASVLICALAKQNVKTAAAVKIIFFILNFV